MKIIVEKPSHEGSQPTAKCQHGPPVEQFRDDYFKCALKETIEIGE